MKAGQAFFHQSYSLIHLPREQGSKDGAFGCLQNIR